MMRRIHHLAAVVLAVSSALLSASCLPSSSVPAETDPGEPQSPNGPERILEAQEADGSVPYMPQDFQFNETRVKDDGETTHSTWLMAEQTSLFRPGGSGDQRHIWRCSLVIGMPLPTAGISASRAARITADIANDVMVSVRDWGNTWDAQGAAFCIDLADGMQAMFRERYPKLGAVVTAFDDAVAPRGDAR